MKSFETKDIRNIGLIGHKAAGKTSAAEAALWSAKVTNRLCSTAEGTSVLDFEDEERKHGMSISTGVAAFEWNRRKVNLLDTPGDGNFLHDTRLAMEAMDGAVCVVSAKDGVEPMTERAFTWAKEAGLATAFFISKMDVENADFQKALDDVKRSLCKEAAALQIPIGKDGGFRGIVNLLSQRAYIFKDGDTGAYAETDIPAEMSDEVEAARNRLIEDIAAADDSLMEKFFEGALTPVEIEAGLAKAMAGGLIVPVYCGSGTLNRGVNLMLDAVVATFPDPSKHRAFSGKLGDQTIERGIDGPMACVVFKTIVDQQSGRISVCRVISGLAKADTTAKNGGRRTTERLGTLNTLLGKKLHAIEDGQAKPGDIFALAKLKETSTGDTLSDDGLVADFVKLPPALISRAVRAKDKGGEDKIKAALTRVTDEDPGLHVTHDENTGEVILSGAGGRHVEITVEKMNRKFGVSCELALPRIPYRETFTVAVKNVEGKHKKQSGGHGQFGVCYLDIEPGERGSGFVFEDAIVGGSIPRQFIPSVEKGLVKAMARGMIAGYPVVDVRVRVFDGKYHAVDSSDMAFQVAASKGLKAAVAKARPALLEPIMNVEIRVPDDNMGDIMSDINTRRGRVMGSESLGRYAVVKAQIPLSEVQTYEAQLRAMTQGRGSFTMDQSHMELVPANIQEKIIKDSGFVALDEED
ncbi:MAG: elongation factor G [Deltaproteobacteria bacterium]|nr:elongation factor G [Deltaproteobacteria bacterium]